MNTTIHHLSGAEDFSGLRVTTASHRVSPIRRFRILIELSDWDEAILRHSKEIDAFCSPAERRRLIFCLILLGIVGNMINI